MIGYDNKCDTCYKKSCSLYHSMDACGPTVYCPDYWPAGLDGVTQAVVYIIGALLLISLGVAIVC